LFSFLEIELAIIVFNAIQSNKKGPAEEFALQGRSFRLACSLSGRMTDYDDSNTNGGDCRGAVDYGIGCDIALFHI
jgi:hypothetical protein